MKMPIIQTISQDILSMKHGQTTAFIGVTGSGKSTLVNLLQTLLRYLEPYRVKIIIVMVFAALSSVFSIVGPKLLGKVTTKLAEGLIAYYLHTDLCMDFDYMAD